MKGSMKGYTHCYRIAGLVDYQSSGKLMVPIANDSSKETRSSYPTGKPVLLSSFMLPAWLLTNSPM